MTKGSWRWSQLSEYFMPEELLLASNCLAPLWLWNGLCGQHSRYRTQPSLLCWFEDSFRLLPFEVYFFKHKRSRNEEGGALPQWLVPQGPQQTPMLVCLTTWKQPPMLGSRKDLTLFPFSHNSSPVSTRLIKHDSLLGAKLFYKLTSCWQH